MKRFLRHLACLAGLLLFIGCSQEEQKPATETPKMSDQDKKIEQEQMKKGMEMNKKYR